MMPFAKDTWSSWIYVGTAFVVHFTISMSMKVWGVMYLILLKQFAQSATVTSWPGSLCSLMMGVAGPLASFLTHALGNRTVTIIGTFLMAAGFVWTGCAYSIYEVYISHGVLVGVGCAFIYTPTFSVINKHFEKRKAIAMGMSTLGAGVGMFLSPLILSMLRKQYGFTGAMIIIGGLNLQTLIVAFLYGRPVSKVEKAGNVVDETDCSSMEKYALTRKSETNGNKIEQELVDFNDDLKMDDDVDLKVIARYDSLEITEQIENSDLEKQISAPLTSANLVIKDTIGDNISIIPFNVKLKKRIANFFICNCLLMTNERFAALFLVNFGYGLSYAIGSSYAPALMKDYGYSTRMAAIVYALSGITDGGARIVTGLMMDLRQVKPHRAQVFNFCQAIGGVAVIFTPLLSSTPGFITSTLIRGVGNGVIFSQRATIAADVVGADCVSDAIGLMLLAFAVGMITANLMGGLMKDKILTYVPSFYLCGIATVMCAIVFLVVVYRYQKKEKGSATTKQEAI